MRTDLDALREVYEAHSIAESDGYASTRQLAKHLGIDGSLRPLAARLNAYARRGYLRCTPGTFDDTHDWQLTPAGLQLLEQQRPNQLQAAPAPLTVHLETTSVVWLLEQLLEQGRHILGIYTTLTSAVEACAHAERRHDIDTAIRRVPLNQPLGSR